MLSNFIIMENNELKNKAKNDKNLVDYTVTELKYVQKPIGKAHYKGPGRPKSGSKSNPTDKVKCKICSKSYTRSNSSNHKKTVYHKTFEKLNNKMRKLLID